MSSDVNSLFHNKKKDDKNIVLPYIGLAFHAKNPILEHTKRGVVAQILFCGDNQSLIAKMSLRTFFEGDSLLLLRE
jgi:hypothetical protein